MPIWSGSSPERWQKAMQAGVPERVEAEMVIHVNQDKAWVGKPPVQVNVPGAPNSYWNSNDGGSLVMLLGAWDTGAFRATLGKSGVITRPQTAVVQIKAERQMAEKLARELKLDILKAQLK